MLLITCTVKVIVPDVSSTIAEALIDPASSASFVHEQITQHLRLPCSNKNVSVEGVAGTSMCAQGSSWFQVFEVEDDAVKIGVDSCILEKITKDLSPHPTSIFVVLILKWDDLSGLKLADSCLKAPAHIDFLLGAEIFTNIVHDVRTTCP